MLEITMPTSFDPRLLDGLEALNARHADRGVRVTELFGSLDRSVVGCGRPSRSLAPIDRPAFEVHARELIARGFHLTYLYNGSCTGNREFSPTERGRLLDELDWVRGLGTRAVVVASPYLVDLIRRRAFAKVRPTCREGCGTCRVCPGFARRGVTIEPAARTAYAQAIEATLERLTADPRA